MKLSLATKIFFGFTLVLAVFGAVSIYGVTQFNTVRNQLNAVNRGLLPLNSAAAEMETLHESARRSTDSILRFDNLAQQRALLLSTRRSYTRNMLSRLQQSQSTLRRIDSLPMSDRDRGFIDDVSRRLERIRERSVEFGAALETVIQGIDPQQGFYASQEDTNALRRSGRRLARDVRLLKRSLKNQITTKMLLLERDESAATGVILWITIIAVSVGILVTFLSLQALRPIRRLAEGARHISKGDFSHTVEVSSEDEFGFLASEFNRMARSLAQREKEAARQQEKLEEVNRELRRSGMDLELMKLYNENIIRSVHNGILVADPRGLITTINPAAERLWNLDPDTTIGKTLRELPIASALSQLTDAWERVLLDEESVLFENMEFDIPARGQILVDLYVSPLLGHDQNVQGVLLVGEDVTEKVRTKQALLQSERLATIGRMSALVAHEIRNPLSSIGLNTEMLEEELESSPPGDTDEAAQLLRSISREVERLTEVTEEYLKFARLPKPNLMPEQLNDILANLLRFVGSELSEAGIELESELDPDLSPVRADEAQLRQAFLNLLRNSIESMPQGGRLRIKTIQSNGTANVQIDDTGSGIDQTCLDRIFDPFFSTRDGGTGLGLSLTQQIVSEHGGLIRCESQPGKGTTFVVELPLSAGEIEAA